MSRRDWVEIATALRRLRGKLLEQERQRAVHRARAEGVELAARAICSTLRAGSSRFDPKRFLKIALTSK